MILNQKGISLVEVMISLTILSVVSLVLWNVLIDGVTYSNKAVSQNTIQQEANLITMNLTKIHQTSEEYEIESSDCKVSVTYRSEKGTSYKEFTHPQLCISSNETTGVFYPGQRDFSLQLQVYDDHYPEKKMNLNTTLYRLKEE
jgi:prepilin-type N-terminal cleavage/methylation domain-containing protein